jgi:hypothetical protein
MNTSMVWIVAVNLTEPITQADRISRLFNFEKCIAGGRSWSGGLVQPLTK